MTKKTRLLILAFCVILFFCVTPFIIAYSLGYRVDFEQREIVPTGGIYVRAYPQATEVIVDSKIVEKPGMFSNSVFVQNLLPKQHSVLIKKDGYFDYQKLLEVKEKEVTKIENVTLFENNIVFESILENAEYFSLSPDKKNILAEGANTKSLDFYYFGVSSPANPKKYSLALPYTSLSDIMWSNDSNKALIKTQNLNGTAFYLLDFSKELQQTAPVSYLNSSLKDISFNPQNSNEIFYIKNNILYSVKNSKATTIIKNLMTYKVSDGNILWLSSDGILSKSDTSGKLIENLASEKIAVSADEKYSIETISGKTFLASTSALYLYNPKTKLLETFGAQIGNYKLLQSPDGKNMVYHNGSEIYLYSFAEDLKVNGEIMPANGVKLFSSNYPETISECFWLNNNYIIFQSGNKIIASEIDYRGNINAVEIPQTYPPSLESKTPQAVFNSQDGKIYILTGNTLYSSKKITP